MTVSNASTIVDKAISRFPGALIYSRIQAFAYLREFELGFREYQNLEHPSADDDRWAGVCAFHQLQDLRAVELFYRSISKGSESARINLAHSLGYIERGDEVADELALVPYNELTLYDKVLYLRVKSMHEEASSHLLQALDDITEAWRLAKNEPEAEPIAVEILSQLAIVESRVGLGKLALRHIEEASRLQIRSIDSTLPIVECSVLLTLGRFWEAIARLGAILADEQVPLQNRCSGQVLVSEANWALGRIEVAVRLFQVASRQAADLNLGYEEFLSRLGLVVLYISTADFDTAFDHLAKAEILISDRSDRALYRFREVLLRFASGAYGPMTALLELEGLIDEMHDMGALQEEGRVRVHAARLLWLMEDPDYTRQLDVLQQLVDRLENAGFLAREWVLMPDFREVAMRTHPGLDNAVADTLAITTIGEPGLSLGAGQVDLPVRHAPAILAFLVDRGSALLADILEQTLPHHKHASARSYFHQFRHQLRTHVPRVSIDFDRATRTYSISTDLQLGWDVHDAGSAGPEAADAFLPGLDTPWARQVRERLAAAETVVTTAVKSRP